MSRLASKPIIFGLSLSASIAALVSGACSHEQKLTKVESPPVARAEEPRRAPPRAPSEPPVAALRTKAEGEAIFFDFDSALLRSEARPVLQKVAAEARGKEKEDLRVEGNCDELGTVEYNLALGDHRARAAKEYLVHLGVPANRIQVVSYGSQRPKFPGHDDDSRAKNRRDDFVLR
jgi:peptidoglycan-associated lipoprotein